MTTHAKLSPSARYRWQLCPASVKACAQYEGERKSSPAAIDGTHSHTLLERCIKKPMNPPIDDPMHFIGTILQDEDGMFGVNADRADRVRVATDYIRSKCKEGTILLSEQRVDPVALLGRNDMSGTVDVQIINGTHLELIDYKDGMNAVEAERNPQLEQYAYGVLSENFAKGLPHNFETVTMTIIQPKIAMKGGNPITSYTVNVEDLLGEQMNQIIIEAHNTDAPDAPFVPGEKQCKYCAHAGNCSAFMNNTLKASGIEFKKVDYVKEAAAVEPNDMTDDKLRELVEAAPLLRKMIESAEEEALRRMEAGHKIAGLKVVRGPGRRSWALPEEEVAAKLTKMTVPKGELYKTSLITPAQLEKLKWTKKDGTEKQLTVKQLEMVQTTLISKSDGKLTVVPEADSRKAVEFADVPAMFVPVVPDVPSWMS